MSRRNGTEQKRHERSNCRSKEKNIRTIQGIDMTPSESATERSVIGESSMMKECVI